MTVAGSPQITSLSWGSIETEDGSYRDAKCWPGGSRGWDWTETGTSHTPGVQVADVREVVDHGAEVVVLSRGQNRRLRVKEETLDWLDAQGVDVEVLETSEAVARYNELAEEGEAVGGLFHSTC